MATMEAWEQALREAGEPTEGTLDVQFDKEHLCPVAVWERHGLWLMMALDPDEVLSADEIRGVISPKVSYAFAHPSVPSWR